MYYHKIFNLPILGGQTWTNSNSQQSDFLQKKKKKSLSEPRMATKKPANFSFSHVFLSHENIPSVSMVISLTLKSFLKKL